MLQAKTPCRSEGVFFATEESRKFEVETLRYRSGRHILGLFLRDTPFISFYKR